MFTQSSTHLWLIHALLETYQHRSEGRMPSAIEDLAEFAQWVESDGWDWFGYMTVSFWGYVIQFG